MSKPLHTWRVEAEHPRRLTNCIQVVRAATKEAAIAAFWRHAPEQSVNGFGPVDDTWTLLEPVRLADGWREDTQRAAHGGAPSR